MFGTSGIRGIYGKDITEELALKIGNVFSKDTLFVARDLRQSGISLSIAVAAGALANGSDVVDIGILQNIMASSLLKMQRKLEKIWKKRLLRDITSRLQGLI